MKQRYLVLGVALATLSNASCRASGQLPLVQVADVALPGNATRLDYQSLDPGKHLLFVAHLGDSRIVVVDTKARRVVGNIPNVRDVHGVLALPKLGTVYASATGTNEVVAISEYSFKLIARTSGGVYPDGIVFDPSTRRVFVSDERGRTETVIDTRSNKRIATIALGGEAGNTQYDPVSRHMFVNVQTLGQLVEIDPLRNTIVKRFTLNGAKCVGNHGLLIDARRRRAFIGCEDNGTLLWLDMKTMRVVAGLPAGEGPDVLALDARTNRLFVAAESGTVSIFANAKRVMPLAQGYLAPAAHTVAVDSGTQLVYFPLENVDGRPVLRIMKEER